MPNSSARGCAVLATAVLLAAVVPGPAGATPARAATPASSPVAVAAPDPGVEPRAAALERWQVTDLGDGSYDVSWTAGTDLPVTSDRPTIVGEGLTFGAPTIGADGRTVSARVTAPDAPDPVDLDVVLSGDRIDETGLGRAPGDGGAPAESFAAPVTELLPAPDPGRTGPFEVVTSDYDLDPVKLPGMKEPVEMVGHVVEPALDAATGPRPLVLVMHGRHQVCYNPDERRDSTDEWPCAAPYEEIPSHLGYDYLQQVLASQGHATVSVRVNGINAQDFRLTDGGAGARAAIVQRHLDRWVGLAEEHRIDLDRVVLVGHSRGGEGVSRASVQIPADAPYRVAGQVLLAPTDFGAQSAPYVPTVTVLPYCDGDVSDIQGQQFTDTGRDLVDDDTSLKSSVLVMGANHNYFNTEWTPGTAVAPASDDWYGGRTEACGRAHPDRLSAAEQRDVATAYVAGAVALLTGDDAYLPLLDGSAVTVDSVGGADVHTHALGGGRALRRPGTEATLSLASGGARTRLCRGVAAYDGGSFGVCGPDVRTRITPHWVPEGAAVPTRQFFEMAWSETGAVGGLRLDEPLDLRSDRLELRTIVDPRSGPVDVEVRLTDSTGASTTVAPQNATDDGDTLAPLLVARGLTKLWAQALLVDPSAGAVDAGVDLGDVVAVELVGRSDRGRVWVADLSAAPADLAPVPDVRLARVQIGDLRVDEGDSPRSRTVRVPFEVDGELTGPARILVQTVGQQRGARQRFPIDLAPGQTSGSVPITVAANTVADYRSQTEIAAWAVSGVATDDYVGRLVVDDDDPEPVLGLRPLQRRVVEGEAIRFRASISALAGYDVGIYLRATRGPGEDLRGNDVPLRWLTRNGNPDEPTRPLHRLYAGVYGQIPAGEDRVDLRIPTRVDRRAEGRERLTVTVRLDGRKILRRTVTVVDARG